MKRVALKELPGGVQRVTLELLPGEKLVVLRDGSFYRLGEPCNDQVLQAHILTEAQPVSWCPIEQRWVD